MFANVGGDMSAIGDALKVLDQIPIWKQLKELPAKVGALQAKVTALEEEVHKRPSIEQCPVCGVGNFKVIAVNPHPKLGMVGVQERTMKCDNPTCGHTEKRIYDPAGRIGKGA